MPAVKAPPAAARWWPVWVGVTALISLAAAVRFWGIRFGLPHTECRPDETTWLQMVWRFGSGDLNPHQFGHPTLFAYLVFGLHGAYILLGLLTGRFRAVEDFVMEVARDPSIAHLMSRTLSATLGTATVLGLWFAARRVSSDRRVPWLAAGFLALAYLHVRDSHFGTNDVTQVFFQVCSMTWILQALADGRLRSYALAGAFAGAAASTKYFSVLLAVPMAAAHALRVGRRQRLRDWLNAKPAVFCALFAAAFIACSPFFLLDLPTALSHVTGQPAYQDPSLLGRGWVHHLRFSLWYGIGWPLLLAAAGGLIWIVRRRHRPGLVMVSLLAAHYMFIGPWDNLFARYTIPLIPWLCLAAALWTVQCADWLGARLPLLSRSALTYALGALLILPSAIRVIQCDRLLARRDNRLVATDWVVRHIPRGRSVCQIATRVGRLQLPETLASLEDDYAWAQERGRGRLVRARLEVRRREGTDGYVQWPFNEVALPPDVYIVHRSPLSGFARGNMPPELPRILASSYTLVKAFPVIPMNGGHRFDGRDGFYLPFDSFHDVERPGPNIEIYVRRGLRFAKVDDVAP